MPAGKTFCCNRLSFENSMGELDPSFLSHGASIHRKNSVETARHFSVSDGALISSDRAVVRSPLTVDTRMRHQRDTGYKNMLAPVRDPTHHDVVKAHRGRQVRHPRSPSHPEKKRSKCGCHKHAAVKRRPLLTSRVLSKLPAGSSAVVSVAAAVAVASPGPVHEAPQPRRPRRGQRSDVGALRLRRPRIRRERQTQHRG